MRHLLLVLSLVTPVAQVDQPDRYAIFWKHQDNYHIVASCSIVADNGWATGCQVEPTGSLDQLVSLLLGRQKLLETYNHELMRRKEQNDDCLLGFCYPQEHKAPPDLAPGVHNAAYQLGGSEIIDGTQDARDWEGDPTLPPFSGPKMAITVSNSDGPRARAELKLIQELYRDLWAMHLDQEDHTPKIHEDIRRQIKKLEKELDKAP